MKVKVTYTVDLEEVPVETNRLLAKVSSKLGSLALEIDKIDMREASELKIADSFDGLRKELFTVDNLLADVEGIIRGYVQTVNTPPQNLATGESDS